MKSLNTNASEQHTEEVRVFPLNCQLQSGF